MITERLPWEVAKLAFLTLAVGLNMVVFGLATLAFGRGFRTGALVALTIWGIVAGLWVVLWGISAGCVALRG